MVEIWLDGDFSKCAGQVLVRMEFDVVAAVDESLGSQRRYYGARGIKRVASNLHS